MTRRVVVVTGSRDWTDCETIRDVLLSICPHIVIHGAAKGADTIAERVSEDLYTTIPMPAQWHLQKGAAGPLRNAQMVEVAKALSMCGYLVTCEAFPLPQSRGTRDCMKKMAVAGFPVNEHEPRNG